ncbi:uncharacterized protein C8A04DRAFT_36416 [Dichotomopilus funicola]|uniref:Zinc finger PHD-type domain-containing protein n=1 Tax=Dichotomopilus funicola TaxID=1934379 RepID=A0AAN6V6W6_9PEZI|nr:hypothetical protein C8A04DRAFT_36416 [Dichotomopilus funicola]
MPISRKRSQQELDSSNALESAQPSILHRIRNMWQFANLFQFILLFGHALKLNDNLDIEDLEAECLKPGSMLLQDIGLGLLKFLSSHRGLTHELFDEYTRRQFLSKAPEHNPFGSDEVPASFANFDVFTKRIEPYGWDRDDRTYYVLDDNRLYRQTEAPLPTPKPKKNTQKAKAAQRASKRRRVSEKAASDAGDDHEEASGANEVAEPEDDGFGGMKWECVAVTLDEIRQFLSTIQKSKDPNEKTLREQIEGHLVPILEKQVEAKKRKQLQREKELLSLEKMAFAKRSSRIAGKLEQQKAEEQAREEEQKRAKQEVARRKQEQQRLKMERERDNRLMSREQRLKERESRRRLHEDELAQLSEDSKDTTGGAARMSERRRMAEIEKNKKALQELEDEEDDWVFDCICGVYGKIDDGTHSVACETCNTWQHSKCLGIDEKDADQEDFHFVCNSCRRREQEASEQRARTIKLKVNRQQQPSSPADEQAAGEGEDAVPQQSRSELVVELESRPAARASSTSQSAQADASHSQEGKTGDSALSGSEAKPKQLPVSHGNNPFSSPHPSLLPSGQPPRLSSGPLLVPASTSHTTTEKPASSAKLTVTTGPLSTTAPGLAGGGPPSPSKQKQSAQNLSSPVTKTPAAVPADNDNYPTNNTTATPLSSIVTMPHLTPAQPRSAGARSDPAGVSVPSSSPLPPSSAGLSPTKHSPPTPRLQQQHQHQNQQQHVNGGALSSSHSSSVAIPVAPSGVGGPPAAVFPPVAALSPSPRQQILTPPVKPSEPVRVPPHTAPQRSPTPKLALASSPRLDAQ